MVARRWLIRHRHVTVEALVRSQLGGEAFGAHGGPVDFHERTTLANGAWRLPENLERLAAFTRRASDRRRAFEARPKTEQPADVAKPADQQQHYTNRPDHSRGAGRDG